MSQDKNVSKSKAQISLFENAIKVKKTRSLMEELERDKRNLTKLMNAKNISESDNNNLQTWKKDYSQKYKNLADEIEKLEVENKDDFQRTLDLQKAFYKKIEKELTASEGHSSTFTVQEVDRTQEVFQETPSDGSTDLTGSDEAESLQFTETPPDSPMGSVASSNTEESMKSIDSMETSADLLETKKVINDLKERARKEILSLYAENKGGIADLLKANLPVAYKRYFSIENGHLEAIGENKETIAQALGLKDGEIHLENFNPQLLEELESKYPKSGLWSVLKSLKPTSSQFTAEEKAKACLDVVGWISQSRIIKTEKTQHALNVLAYASAVSSEKKGVLLTIQHLLTGIGQNDLTTWFKRKLNQHHYEIPKRLLDNIQTNWLDAAIPRALEQQALKMKQWVEVQQQKLVSNSGGVLKSINTNGELIHFKPLEHALASKDKNCYVWFENKLSYIDDHYHVEEDIAVINRDLLNHEKEKYVTPGVYNVTYKFLKEADFNKLITLNTDPQHIPSKGDFQIKRWLHDVEKEHREDVFAWDKDVSSQHEDITALVKANYKLIYLINGYYENEILLLTDLDEFKSILTARLEEIKLGINPEALTQPEQIVLEQFIKIFNELTALQIALRKEYPVPNTNTTIEKSLNLLEEEFSSRIFSQYMAALSDLGVAAEKLKTVMSAHPSFLAERHIEGTTTRMEIRSKGTEEAYLQPVPMRITRVEDKLKEMQSIFQKKISPIKPEAKQQESVIAKIIEHFIGFKKKYNQSTIDHSEYQSIHKLMNHYLSQNTPHDAAIKAILTGNNINQTKAYLHSFLPIICPEIFVENEGGIDMVAPDRHWRSIFHALGLSVYDKNNAIELDPRQFDAKLLTEVMNKYPKERAVFTLLKSLKPIDAGFSAKDKVAACIDLANLICEKKVISSQKLQFALNVLAYAYNEVELHVKTDEEAKKALTDIEELFSKKPLLQNSKLQKWVNDKSKQKETFQIPSTIHKIMEKVSKLDDQNNKSKNPLSGLIWLGKKMRDVILPEDPNQISSEDLPNSGPKKQ